MEGTDQSIADMVKTTRRGLLVTFFWYIRPSINQTLLNTGMTRDGLFLIENGEIAGPVQNFRWNMSPIVGYNNITAVGKPVPIHTGESYDGAGHGAGAAGQDRGLLDDLGLAGGLTGSGHRSDDNSRRSNSNSRREPCEVSRLGVGSWALGVDD